MDIVEIRLKCLEIASGTADPDSAVPPQEMLIRAEVFYRYVIDGPRDENVVPIAVDKRESGR